MILSLIPAEILDPEYIGSLEKMTGEKILAYRKENFDKSLLPETEIMVVFGRAERELIEACTSLKWLFSISAGVEKLPFDLLKKKGVIVTNSRGIHGEQISEQVLGMMLCFSRNLIRCSKNQAKKIWEQLLPVEELSGKNLCIIGAGAIGREIARKASAFDMNITGIKKQPENLEYFNSVTGIDRLRENLMTADYAVLITPLTDETYHLMGKEEFASMKKSSVFINVSRGDTVDEDALIYALLNGIIAGAGLDVFHTEPLPPENPLWKMENVIITPHNSGVSPHYMEKCFDLFVKSLAEFREGKIPPNLINLDRKY